MFEENRNLRCKNEIKVVFVVLHAKRKSYQKKMCHKICHDRRVQVIEFYMNNAMTTSQLVIGISYCAICGHNLLF